MSLLNIKYSKLYIFTQLQMCYVVKVLRIIDCRNIIKMGHLCLAELKLTKRNPKSIKILQENSDTRK